jgi:uncharacterized protein
MRNILIEKNLMVPMREGVRLAIDVYRLEGQGPAPVLLARTPYNKEQAVAGGGGVGFDIIRAVQAGYAVVIQDGRGQRRLSRHRQARPRAADHADKLL